MKSLTIGLPVFDDFDGLYFTVQTIRTYHPEILADTEFLIVDNNPGSAQGKAVKDFVGWVKQRDAIRYIPFTETRGAANSKQEVFNNATTPYVLCMDCHVLLEPASLRKLLWMFDTGEDGGNLLQGPLVYDNLTSTSTHFAILWRGDMLGIWASAWRCPCGGTFQTHLKPDGQRNLLSFLSMDLPHREIEACQQCGRALPTGRPWDCHEPVLQDRDFSSASYGQPYEIPAQGMGVFACRRDAWQGFNERFRGFGGEECYIHEKFRRAGRKTLCLPFLKWSHRFQRPTGIPYQPILEDRIFNYLVGHREMQMSQDEVTAQFQGKIPAETMDTLICEANSPVSIGSIQILQS